MVPMGQPNRPSDATDTTDMPGTPDAPRWTLEHRGSFLFGQCRVCGFTSPGRRARHSAEDDMRAHTLLCRSAEALQPEGVAEVRASER